MEENIKGFLYYGISQEIPRKQIFDVDILTVLFAVAGCVIESQSVVINCIIIFISVCNIVLTFHKTEVKGEKIFWVYGIWSVYFTVFFLVLGTKIAFSVMPEADHMIFAICVVLGYILVASGYVGILLCLIKRNAYKKLKKTNGRSLIGFSALGGVIIAKILFTGMSYKNILQIAVTCCFLLAALALLGCFNLIKFWGVKHINAVGEKEK